MSAIHLAGTAQAGHLELEVDLSVEPGETVALLGPNGAGKTSLLRILTGLLPLTRGHLDLSDHAADVPDAGVFAEPHKRPIGWVPQDRLLFPHLTVKQNVGFSPRARPERVDQLLEVLDITELADRRPSSCSGGQAQRVALARSLAPGPRLLMLDEPLGSLDRALRDRLVDELGVLLRRLGQAAIHVTHDHDEAFTLADRIAVMADGQIARTGTPSEVWADPRSVAVARSVGHRNLLDLNPDGSCALGRLGTGPGTVLVRGYQLTLQEGAQPARVIGVVFRNGRTEVTVSVDGLELSLFTDRPVARGETVGLHLADEAVVGLDGA